MKRQMLVVGEGAGIDQILQIELRWVIRMVMLKTVWQICLSFPYVRQYPVNYENMSNFNKTKIVIIINQWDCHEVIGYIILGWSHGTHEKKTRKENSKVIFSAFLAWLDKINNRACHSPEWYALYLNFKRCRFA